MCNIEKSGCPHHNIENLRTDFVDLLFCLDLAQHNQSIMSIKSITSFKNDLYYVLRLLDRCEKGELRAENIPVFTEFTSNLYLLLHETFYVSAYFKRDDYKTFLTQFEESPYAKSYLR